MVLFTFCLNELCVYVYTSFSHLDMFRDGECEKSAGFLERCCMLADSPAECKLHCVLNKTEDVMGEYVAVKRQLQHMC